MGALFGILAVVFLVTRLDQLGSGGDAQTVPTGDPIFTLGEAEGLAEEVVERPFLIPDAANGDRDIWVQHLGPNPTEGWLAFGVRPPGTDQQCFADWNQDDRTFVDTCDGTVYPEDGEGLPQYGVSVNPDGDLTINLNAVDAQAG